MPYCAILLKRETKISHRTVLYCSGENEGLTPYCAILLKRETEISCCTVLCYSEENRKLDGIPCFAILHQTSNGGHPSLLHSRPMLPRNHLLRPFQCLDVCLPLPEMQEGQLISSSSWCQIEDSIMIFIYFSPCFR